MLGSMRWRRLTENVCPSESEIEKPYAEKNHDLASEPEKHEVERSTRVWAPECASSGRVSEKNGLCSRRGVPPL